MRPHKSWQSRQQNAMCQQRHCRDGDRIRQGRHKLSEFFGQAVAFALHTLRSWQHTLSGLRQSMTAMCVAHKEGRAKLAFKAFHPPRDGRIADPKPTGRLHQ